MDVSQYLDIPIVCAVYILAEIAKKLFLKSDKSRGLIPILGTIAGIIISLCIFIFLPEYSTSTSIISAFANGAISGGAATGANQIYKQVLRFFNTDATVYEESESSEDT